MSIKYKTQQFQKSIRRKQLNDLFDKKRIKLLQQSRIIQQRSESALNEYDEKSLRAIAKICQTQEGIQKINQAKIQSKLYSFFNENFLNTQSQNLATYIVCNLWVQYHPQAPNHRLTLDILNILEKGSDKAISNCLYLVFNILNDHFSWKDELIQNHSMATILIRLLLKQSQTPLIKVQILRCLTKITEKFKKHQSFIPLIQILSFCLANYFSCDRQILTYSFACFYHLSIMFPEKATEAIQTQLFFPSLLKIARELYSTKFTSIAFMLIQYNIPSLSQEDIHNYVIIYLESILQQGCHDSNKRIKINLYELFIKLLEEGKITPSQLMSINSGHLLVNQFEEETDSELLHILVYLFSIVLMNIEIGTWLCVKLEGLLERVEKICPDQIQTIGFVKQTLYKSKRKAELLI